MWLERIQKFRKINKKILDFKLELHSAIYIQGLLNDIIEFKSENDSLKILINKKEISKGDLFYWWQITLFYEIINEEEIIYNDFCKLKDKLNSAIKKVENSKDKNETKEKIDKLNNHLKEEADKSNINIKLLQNFRMMFYTFESFEIFLNNIKIILNANNEE